MMKTAGTENQKRCPIEAASRDHGTEGTTILLNGAGWKPRKKPAAGKVFFS
jgi:hypothetical protein